MSSLTFITSFFHIYKDEYDKKKTVEWRIERFGEIAKLGIKICVYVGPDMYDRIREIEEEYPDNIKIMKQIHYTETFIHQILANREYKMPNVRSDLKDIPEYLIVINSKTEFMKDTIEKNPWNSTHFAWIDFNITHVFFKPYYTFPFLRWLSAQTFFKPSFFINPGCWKKWQGDNISLITDSVYWRFCGGFFMGDKASILRFHDLYCEYFPKFIEEHHTLVWEVNFWAWLEQNSDWNPTWYLADHNDSIVNDMPAEVFTNSLEHGGHLLKYTYDYPSVVPIYFASSASYLNYYGKHILNTRYVNYRYTNDGHYMFYEDRSIIRNRNFFSELHPYTMMPYNYTEMEETIDLRKEDHYSRGIEDIRLYEFGGKIKFIATTVNYYHTGGNRMLIGDYCLPTPYDQDMLTKGHYENTKLVKSPENNYLEKNWVPIILNNPASKYHKRELFIYKWCPFTIAELVPNPDYKPFEEGEDKQNDNVEELMLNIVESVDVMKNPFFWKIKGSAPFVDTGEYLVGIVHFTEDKKPRQYFNMMVILDRTTLIPIRYSDVFCFERVAIEFCIGFTIRDGQYWFWISRMDRDPLLVRIDVDKIPIRWEFAI